MKAKLRLFQIKFVGSKPSLSNIKEVLQAKGKYQVESDFPQRIYHRVEFIVCVDVNV